MTIGNYKNTQKLSYSISETCQIIGIGRTSLYAAIKSGKIVTKKYGKRTLVCAESVSQFWDHLPVGSMAHGGH